MYLTFQDGNFKWNGSFQELKNFFEKLFQLEPGKNDNQFKIKSPQVGTITFHETTKTVQIQGNPANKKAIETILKQQLAPDNKSEARESDDTSTSTFTKFSMPETTTESEEIESKQDDINVKNDEKEISKVRSLALQFMFKNPSCIRAIPYENKDAKYLTTCLYMDTNGEEISEEIKVAANEMFGNDKFEFDNLSRRPPSKDFKELPTSEKKKRQELADITRKIEENLKLFEDRMNVTAVQASYKVTGSKEENIPCVTVYVLGKGKIPAGETDITEIKDKSGGVFDKIEFDVAEGYYKLATGSSLKGSALPLEGGVGIGAEGADETGTLGGFLEDEKRNVYILSNQHVLHPTNDAGGAIFQPSHDDYEFMQREAQRNIQRWNNERQRILDGNEDNQEYRNLVRSIDQKIEKNRNILSEILQNPPRPIGTYVWGLQDNVQVNDRDFYVDAAIATLDRNEQRVMIYHKNQIEDQANRCPLYGFETNKYWTTADYNPPNGEIINFETFQELLLSDDPGLRFMKIGRTTGLTDEGFVKQSPIYVRHIQPNGLHVKFDWGYNCLPIRKHTGSFSDNGDSGSLVFDQNGRAWGLVFAMFNDCILVSPLFAIVARLEQEAGIKQLTLWRTPNQEKSNYEEASHDL